MTIKSELNSGTLPVIVLFLLVCKFLFAQPYPHEAVVLQPALGSLCAIVAENQLADDQPDDLLASFWIPHLPSAVTPNASTGQTALPREGGSLSTGALPGSGPITAVSSGVWNDPANWSPQQVPTASDDVVISEGTTISVNSSNAQCNQLTIAGTLQFDSGSVLVLYGDWINHGTSLTEPGTVRFAGAGDSRIGGTQASSFYNLILDKDELSVLALEEHDLTVTNMLTMKGGYLDGATSNRVTSLTNPDIGSLSISGGSIRGAFRRAIKDSGAAGYLFPVGDATNQLPVELNLGSISQGGTITVSPASGYPALPGSLLDDQTGLDAHWTVSNQGVAFGSLGGRLSFPASLATDGPYQLGVYDAGSWTYPTVSSTTESSLSFSGLTVIDNASFSLAGCLPPTISLGPNPTICQGSSTVVLSYQTPVNSPDEYRIDFDAAAEAAGMTAIEWSPLPPDAISFSIPGGVGAGTYQAVLQVRNDASCSSEEMPFSITIKPAPTATWSSEDQMICEGESATLSVNLTGEAPWTLTYSDGSSSLTISGINSTPHSWTVSPASTKTYTLTAVSDANCNGAPLSETSEITVGRQPIALAGPSETVCAGSSTAITGATALFGTILWTHDGQGSLLDETSLIPTYVADALDAGETVTLSLTVTSNNACAPQQATASRQLEVMDCLPQCASVTRCDYDLFQLNSVTEFVAAGGQINFPCSVSDDHIQLISTSSNGELCPETITQTYEIWDDCGNRARCQAMILIDDTEPPSLSGIPADIPDLVCTNPPPPPELYTEITATDNCGAPVEIVFEETSTQKFDNSYESVVYTITRTWTAIDACGNSTFDTQTIHVRCEYCSNGLDDDGDGLVDENDPKCPCSSPSYKLDCNFNQMYYIPPVWQMDTSYGTDGNTYTNPSSLVISTPFGTANVNIRTTDGTTFNQNYTITQGTAQEIPLTYDLVQTPNYNTTETNRGLIVESDQLVQVVYRIAADNNKMMVTIKGEQALGQWFRVASQTNVCDAPNTDKRENHFISVMAVEDNTTVNFDFKAPMKGLGSTHQVTLDAGETYLVIDDDNNQTVTGSLVTANRTIAVVSGSQHSRQCSDSGRDGGADQLIPTCGLGSNYVISRGQDNDDPSQANYAVIVGVTENTQIFIDGNTTPVATIGPGEYHTYNMPSPDFSNHYIQTSEPAYVYQFGSIMTNGEIGMAIASPIDGCRGDRYIEFFKFPGAPTNNTTFIIPDAGLASLTLNGTPYANFGISPQPIPGLTGWSTVTFSETDMNNYNIVESDEYFNASQFVGDVAGGTMGYLTSFKDKIDIFDPETGEKTYEYFAGSICGGQPFEHTIDATSCSGSRYISGFIGGGNTESYKIFPNSITFQYTPKAGFSGEDHVTLIIADESGLAQPVCLNFYVCGEAPVISCPEDLTLEASEGTCLSDPTELGTVTATGGCSSTDELVITNDAPEQFPVGETLVTWTATDSCGNFSQCYQTVRVSDHEPPSFSPPAPITACVESIFEAVYNSETGDINPGRPEYYRFPAGDTALDLTDMTDNCCAANDMTLHWQIDFAPTPALSPPHDPISKSSISGTGQLSTYGSDILFPGDGVTFTDVEHTISYWLTDCNNNTTGIQTTTFTVTPRPNIIKMQ